MKKYYLLPVVYGLFISVVVSNAVVPAVRARVSSHFMSRIVIGAKIDVERRTPRLRSRERVPDSFHFSFNRIVTVVFIVNIVVLLCKYNINSDADKRFGNAIKNEKRRFFPFSFPAPSPQIYRGRHLTFVAPLGILYMCAACIFNGTARIYSRRQDCRKKAENAQRNVNTVQASFFSVSQCPFPVCTIRSIKERISCIRKNNAKLC